MDMFQLTMKAMGLDPNALMAQASQMGQAFEAIVAMQREAADQLARIESNQLTVMEAMGLYVAPLPTGDMARLIADESRRFTDPPDQALLTEDAA
jgi:hypothetical protein